MLFVAATDELLRTFRRLNAQMPNTYPRRRAARVTVARLRHAKNRSKARYDRNTY